MRTRFVIAVSVVFLASASAFAQRPPAKANSFTVFMSEANLSVSSESGTHFDAEYGLALQHHFTDRLSAELSVTSRRYRPYPLFTGQGQTAGPRTSRAYPFDATVAYHLVNDSRWQPYLGGGFRYIHESFLGITQSGTVDYTATARSLDPEVAGGVVFKFRPSLGLRFDAKQVLRHRANIIDSNFKSSIGLAWRF